MVSMPAMILVADQNVLKPIIGRVRPVLLLDEVVQAFGLAKLDGHATVGDQVSHGGHVRAALV
jgi:hypothetical protein